MALYNNEISIVIATYNGVLFIEEQIESIARGTLLPNEIIIVDDRSTDNTVLLLNNIKRNHPELNIKIIINDSNIGAHSTFKKAIKLAKGKYIAPCDQDDIWEKNHIEILYNEIKKNNCDLVFGQDRIMYEDGERINNQSVRERFELSKNDSSIASRIISDTLEAGLIKPADIETASKKYMTYIPYYG